MQRTRNLASVLGTLLALGATFGAVAAEPVADDSRSITIEYGDLDLGNGLVVQRAEVTAPNVITVIAWNASGGALAPPTGVGAQPWKVRWIDLAA